VEKGQRGERKGGDLAGKKKERTKKRKRTLGAKWGKKSFSNKPVVLLGRVKKKGKIFPHPTPGDAKRGGSQGKPWRNRKA